MSSKCTHTKCHTCVCVRACVYSGFISILLHWVAVTLVSNLASFHKQFPVKSDSILCHPRSQGTWWNPLSLWWKVLRQWSSNSSFYYRKIFFIFICVLPLLFCSLLHHQCLAPCHAHKVQSMFLSYIQGQARWMEMTGIGEVPAFKHKMDLGIKCWGWASCVSIKKKSIPGGKWNTSWPKPRSQEWVQCVFRIIIRELRRQGGRMEDESHGWELFRIPSMNKVGKPLFRNF